MRSVERVLCVADVAENFWTRGSGLLGKGGLPEGRALWIRPCTSVHTMFMRFPIDVVYLASDGTVVKTCSRLRPFRFSAGGRGAHSVLELPPGFLCDVPISVGEQLVTETSATDLQNIA